MNILVTGGVGYIGSHTVVELLKKKHNVIILDNLCNSHEDSISKIEMLGGRKIKFYCGDVRDADIIKTIFRENDIESVIHFAGLKSVSESINDPISYYTTNVSGTLTLVMEMLEAGVNKLIFSSSATVYGVPEKTPLSEECRTGGTTNPYGTSKYIAELILKDIAFANSNMDITVLRYFNPVGAHPSGIIGESPKGIPNNLVPYLTRVAAGKLDSLSIYGNDYPTKDGTGVRDFIHVVDLAKGHLAAIEANSVDPKLTNFNVYNLGTGCGYSVLELVQTFERITGKSIKYKFCERRDGDVGECWSDASLAKKQLQWSASKTLDEMLHDAWTWELNN